MGIFLRAPSLDTSCRQQATAYISFGANKDYLFPCHSSSIDPLLWRRTANIGLCTACLYQENWLWHLGGSRYWMGFGYKYHSLLQRFTTNVHIYTVGSIYRTTFNPYFGTFGILHFHTPSTHLLHSLLILCRHQALFDHLFRCSQVWLHDWQWLSKLGIGWIHYISKQAIFGISTRRSISFMTAIIKYMQCPGNNYQQRMSFMDESFQQTCCHLCYGSGYIISSSTCTDAFGLSFIKMWFICSLPYMCVLQNLRVVIFVSTWLSWKLFCLLSYSQTLA